MDINKRQASVVVPLITPLTESYTLDEAAVERIIELIKENLCSPFILGTTGEAASLPFSLKKAYVKKAASMKSKYNPLFAGIGSNCLDDSIEMARQFFDTGADAVVATLPSYYQLTESQMMK